MAACLAILLKSGKIEPNPRVAFEVPTVGEGKLDASLNNRLFFRKGHDDFASVIPMAG